MRYLIRSHWDADYCRFDGLAFSSLRAARSAFPRMYGARFPDGREGDSIALYASRGDMYRDREGEAPRLVRCVIEVWSDRDVARAARADREAT